MFLWLLMFQQDKLGFRPHQRWGWQRERGACIWTGWRCSNALLYPACHLHGGASLLGAGGCGVPCLGGSARGKQTHAATGHAPGLLGELHLCWTRQPAELDRGRVRGNPCLNFHLEDFEMLRKLARKLLLSSLLTFSNGWDITHHGM